MACTAGAVAHAVAACAAVAAPSAPPSPQQPLALTASSHPAPEPG